jgi:cyclophilin family peptidyl-prolyl cis-trans isomerase
MSGTAPQQAGAPTTTTPFELLWERHRGKANILMTLVIGGIVAYYSIRYFEQRAVDKTWSAFASAALLDEAYASSDESLQMTGSLETSLVGALAKADPAKMDSFARELSGQGTPYLKWILANKALSERQWDQAESIVKEIERDYQKHHICLESDYPVQARDEVREDPVKAKAHPEKEPELKPAKKGSLTALFREQIQSGRTFAEPTQFAKPTIPADSPRYRIKFSSEGDVVVVLLPGVAPLHCKEFQELVNTNFWNDRNVDEVQRPTPQNKFRPTQLHFGFDTRSENASEWDTTKASTHLVEEVTGLSHFPGAIAARADSDGKSCVDRLWISVEDTASQDGHRQVFGYVESGLENVRKICEASLASTEEEQRGQGRPSTRVKVVSVTRE